MRLASFIGAVLLGILGLVIFTGTGHAQEPAAGFMKAKLLHSQQVLRGLAIEDFDLIAKNANTMSLLCADQAWMVIQTVEYRERLTEFRRSVDSVTDAAKAKNIEAAALGYVDMTMKCVNCHKYVRKVQTSGTENATPAKSETKP